MADLMKKYIEEQADIWQSAATSLISPLCSTAAAMDGCRRIVMIGSGSSYYAACAAAALLQKESREISFFTAVPTSLGAFEYPAEDMCYLAISQSGKSTSTEQAVRQLLTRNARVFTLTSDAASPLASMGEHVLIPCGEESVGPKTKGMTTSLLTLWLLGQALLCRYDKEVLMHKAGLLMPAFREAGYNCSLSFEFAHRHSASLAAARCITVIADGAAYPLAQEGALKLLETLYIPAAAWEFEEYLHGVHNSISTDAAMIFILRKNSQYDRMKKLIAYCGKQGGTCFVIDCTGCASKDPHTLSLHTCGSDEALAYEALIPFQIISAIVSEYKGINCDKPRFPDFYAALGTKIQQEGTAI